MPISCHVGNEVTSRRQCTFPTIEETTMMTRALYTVVNGVVATHQTGKCGVKIEDMHSRYWI